MIPRPGPAIRLAGLLFTAFLISACTPTRQPIGESLSTPSLNETHFITADEITLPLRVWRPEGMYRQWGPDNPRAVILALHGFNDYSHAFERPGAYFADQGIITYAFDQRGFGQAPHRGLWAGADIMADDARALLTLLAARWPNVPLYLLGDSMGGAVTLTLLAAPMPVEISGAILIAPAVWGRKVMNPLQSATLWLAAHTLPWMTLTGRHLKIQASDNIPMLMALSQDPLMIRETRIDTIYGLVDLMDAGLSSAPWVETPLLVFYGGEDQVIPKKSMAALVEALADNKHRFALYEGGNHMLLRDLGAQIVYEDILAWIAGRQAGQNLPLPSGADRDVLERWEKARAQDD